MYTNIIRYQNNIILVCDGTFEECIARLEKRFGECRGWNISNGHGTIWFSTEHNFVWEIVEKNFIQWNEQDAQASFNFM